MRVCPCGKTALPVINGKGLRCDGCAKKRDRDFAAKYRAKNVIKPSKYVSPSIDTHKLLQREWI